MNKVVTSLAIIGDSFDQWVKLKEQCDQSTEDKSGLAAGILTRTYDTQFGNFTVKFLLLFVNKKLPHNLKPTFRFTMKELMDEGLESILAKIGHKTIINAQRKLSALSRPQE
nr:MAG: hypothetical protein JSV04_07025 [Candidatus Heimdallarchaeota archaeon]